jgi:hypothetical protein
VVVAAAPVPLLALEVRAVVEVQITVLIPEVLVILRLPHLVRAITVEQTMAIQAVVEVAQVLWAAQVAPVTHKVVLVVLDQLQQLLLQLMLLHIP